MCGIIGYVGPRDAVEIVIDGLRRLEYRGYDSAGLAIHTVGDGIAVYRQAGKLARLEKLLDTAPVTGHTCIGHTRWATHGAPVQRNAHPHSSPDGKLAIVQNGIVENFSQLRACLQNEGYEFQSDTDTEVIVHLIHRYYTNGSRRDLITAVRRAAARLEGPNAIAVLSATHPKQLIVFRLGNAGGIVIGRAENASLISSDIPALLPHTRNLQFLEDRQMAVLTPGQVDITDLNGAPVELPVFTIKWDADAAGKGQFPHFMQKEIHEQGQSIQATIAGRVDFVTGQVQLPSLNLTPEAGRRLRKITIVACGTSYYAGLVGKSLIERLAGVPVEVDYASEYRYRSPIIATDEMVLAVSQSGETVDTLTALEEARNQGAFTVAIVNAIGSQATRATDGMILMNVGPEIGVASTKAFTASVVDLLLLGLYLAQCRSTLSPDERSALVQALASLPGLAGQMLTEARTDTHITMLAQKYCAYHNFLYLGRGLNYPIALEGALKLKEISYIHAEGCPAGEMKHGPIALIDEAMPTIVIALQDKVYKKMISQIEQVKARNGTVIAVCNTDDEIVPRLADDVLPVPRSHELVAPILAVLPLQLLAYEIARLRGCDVDQPRNLAKSVTVE